MRSVATEALRRSKEPCCWGLPRAAAHTAAIETLPVRLCDAAILSRNDIGRRARLRPVRRDTMWDAFLELDGRTLDTDRVCPLAAGRLRTFGNVRRQVGRGTLAVQRLVRRLR